MEEVLRIAMLIAAFTIGGMTIEIRDLNDEITALKEELNNDK